MRLVLVIMLAFQGVFPSPIQSARGAHIAAQCQARCYQLLDAAAQQETAASDEAEQDTWSCEGAPDDEVPCHQCLRELNVTRSHCVEICKTGLVDCKDSCQCLHHNKVANVMEPQVTPHEVPTSAVQLLCKDVFVDGASLVVRLVPDPNTTQPVVLVAEVQSQRGQWIEALTSNTNTLEIRELQFEHEYHVRVSAYGASGLLVAAEAGPFTTLARDHTPTAVREVHVAGVRLDPAGHSALLLNVTWQPAADNVCCHTIINFKPPSFEDTRVCEPGRNWVSVHRVQPGESVNIAVRAETSIRGRESIKKMIGYTIPSCPFFNGTKTQLLKFCNPPSLSRLCSLESKSQGEVSDRKLRLDMKLTWNVPALPSHAPRIIVYRISVQQLNGVVINTTSVPAVNPERQDNSSTMHVVLRDVEVQRGMAYNVSVQAEDERGYLGTPTFLKRQPVDTTGRQRAQRQNAGEGSFVGGDCQPSAPVMSTQPPRPSSPRPPPLINPEASADTPWGGSRGVAGGAVTATTVAAGAATLVLAVAGVVALAARRYSQWRRRVKRHGSRRPFEPEGHERCGKSSQASSEYEPLKCDRPASPKARPEARPEERQEAGGELHVARERLRLGAVLGEGAFGVVRRAEMRRSPSDAWQTVAVKMLKEGAASSEDRRQLLREVALMKAVGRHPHLVCMLACSGPHEAAPFLVVEHCELGDLQHFLRQQWHRLIERAPSAGTRDIVVNHAYGYQNDSIEKIEKMAEDDEEDILTPAELLSIARQVALGMEFLSSNRVVHRDLAARNVLVTAERSVKIADFGLSRDVYEQNVYRKTSEGRLPIKWMALESLLHQIYTSASDVWSFGILLWEIVTLGGTPYPGIATGHVFSLLRSGYRMERPDNCSQQLYDVMLSCWYAKPSDRPAFSQLREQIEEMMETCGTAGPYLPLQHDGADCSGSSAEETTSLSEPNLTEPKDPNYLQPLSASPEEDAAQQQKS